MYNFHLPLTNEEQAMLLLWHKIAEDLEFDLDQEKRIQATICEIIAASTRIAVEEATANHARQNTKPLNKPTSDR